jgi:hypothetical protein
VRLSGFVFVVRVCPGVGSGRWNHDGQIFQLVIISHCNPVFGLCNRDISMRLSYDFCNAFIYLLIYIILLLFFKLNIKKKKKKKNVDKMAGEETDQWHNFLISNPNSGSILIKFHA